MTVYTDGSILTNPGGPGGWAFIIPVENGEDIVRTGMDPDTTNNRMEIMAVLQAIEYIMGNYPADSINIISDSQYVVNTINDWIHKWVLNDFKKKKNVDLWKRIYELMTYRSIKAEWIRGHDGDPYNEQCDKLAREVYR